MSSTSGKGESSVSNTVPLSTVSGRTPPLHCEPISSPFHKGTALSRVHIEPQVIESLMSIGYSFALVGCDPERPWIPLDGQNTIATVAAAQDNPVFSEPALERDRSIAGGPLVPVVGSPV